MKHRWNQILIHHFYSVKCATQRQFAGIHNVPFVSSRLSLQNTRIPFTDAEQLMELLSELVDWLSPQGGQILDLYVKLLSTNIVSA